ncbi:MAG: lipopolysaccharide biosynthesis protein [Terracidiphilus sp.]
MTTNTGETTMREDTARNVAWNYAGYIYQIGIGVGLTSYIARQLAVPEYGLLLFVTSLSGTLYLLDFGISGVLVQTYIAEPRGSEKTSLSDLLSTTFLTLTALGSVAGLMLVGIAQFLPGPFNIQKPYLHEASIIFVVAALTIQVGLPVISLEMVYQASHRFDRLNQIQFIVSTFQLIVTVGVLALGRGIVALACVQLAAAMLQVLLLVLALPGAIPEVHLSLRRFQGRLLRPLLGLSKWAFVNNTSNYALDLVAWTAVGTMSSMREAALFGIALKLPVQLSNVVSKGADVFMPLMSSSSSEADRGKLQRTFLEAQRLAIGAIVPFIVLGCVVARPLIQVWAGDKYTAAALAMQWLLFSVLPHAAAYPSFQLLIASSQMKKGAAITLCTNIITAASCLLLVSRYGSAGLGFSMALPHLLITCFWSVPTACKLSHITPGHLLREVGRGLAVPFAALLAGVALILGFWRFLSPLWLVLAAIAVGCGYLWLWGARAALPLLRKPPEAVL